MEDKLYDPLRRKYLDRTPEEQVRQLIIQWFNEDKGVSYNRMMSEYSLNYNGLMYRADIVVFGNSLEPLMLVECKAPSVKIDRSVLEQGIRYNRVLNVRYLMLTNGTSTCIWGVNKETKEYEFLSDMPSYLEMTLAL